MALLATSLFTACASGPAFISPQTPPAGMALVYLYRPFTLNGAARQFAVSLNGQPIGNLPAGAHLQILHSEKEGQFRLQVQGCAGTPQAMLVRAGQATYLEAQVQPRMVQVGGRAYFDHACHLQQRSPGEALPLITGMPLAN